MTNYYDIKRVSNSSLKWFEVSPKFFRMMLDKEIDQENEFIFKRGKMVHSYLLQPKEFEQEYVFLDYETPKSQQQKSFCETYARAKKGTEDEKLLKAYKESYTIKENDDKILEKANVLRNQFKEYIKSIKLSPIKIVLPKSSLEKLQDIKKEILNHKVASNLIITDIKTILSTDNIEIHNEFEIYFEYQGVECKAMLDRVILDHTNKIIKLVDLKTSVDYDIFNDKLFYYKYYRQLAFYWLALSEYCKKNDIDINDYKKESFIVVVNMKEPTEVKVYKLLDNTINQGKIEIDNLIIKLKWHFDNNLWDYPYNYYEGEGIEEL